VWRNEQIVRYIYQLSDPSYAYREGFHFHVETNTRGQAVYHYTRKAGAEPSAWTEHQRETPLADALSAFVDTILRLRRS
jgi:hypothetical protein